jgi:hypothetical protein
MKSNHPEASLRSGSMPPVTGMKAHGNKQGSNDTPMAESNTETLRHGKAPKPEMVKHAAHNPATQKRAQMFNERSENGGAEKNGGY